MRLFFLLTLALVPTIAFGQQQFLVGIPQLQSGEGFNGYINAVYAMFISIAALLAVVKIIVAGVKYMFSDIATQKSDAKKDIRGALLGLVIVLAAVLILTIINPNLTRFDPSSIQQIDETVPVETRIGPSVVATLEERCSTGSECSIQNCELTATLTGLNLANRCADLCTGELGGLPLSPVAENQAPRCLTVGDTTPTEILEEIVNDPEFCGDAGCSSFECTGSCSQCLTGHGGRVIENEIDPLYKVCSVPRFNLGNGPVSIPCRDADGELSSSCRLTTRACEGDDYGSYSDGVASNSYVDSEGRYTIDCSLAE